jgi:hypothetical protein
MFATVYRVEEGALPKRGRFAQEVFVAKRRGSPVTTLRGRAKVIV